jgi:hypothetical protein
VSALKVAGKQRILPAPPPASRRLLLTHNAAVRVNVTPVAGGPGDAA